MELDCSKLMLGG